jgi:hypothetical protein
MYQCSHSKAQQQNKAEIPHFYESNRATSNNREQNNSNSTDIQQSKIVTAAIQWLISATRQRGTMRQ